MLNIRHKAMSALAGKSKRYVNVKDPKNNYRIYGSTSWQIMKSGQSGK